MSYSTNYLGNPPQTLFANLRTHLRHLTHISGIHQGVTVTRMLQTI